MKLFVLNSFAILLLILFAVQAWGNQEQRPPTSSLEKGVVIEQLTGQLEAVKAGMQPGDVLLSWTQGVIHGEVESPFDLLHIRYDHASRGKVTIFGIRKERKTSWALGSEPWGIWARPNFSGPLLGKYLECQGLPATTELEEAWQCWRQALTEAESLPAAWLRSWLLSQAAQQFANKSAWEASDAAYREALEHAATSSHELRGGLLIQWAFRLKLRNDLVNAERRYEEVVGEWSKPGVEVMAIAAPLLELGVAALRQGNYQKAEGAFQQALLIGEKLAPSSLETALAYGNLGVLYQERGELAKAEEYYRHALAIEREYLPRSQYLAQQLTNLGTLARERGDLEAAETSHREALVIEKDLGLENPLAANILDNLSDCFLDGNDLQKAEQYQRQALAIRQKLEPGSLKMASSLASLGKIAQIGGNLSQAEEYYDQAVAIGEKLRPQPPAIGDFMAGLASVARKKGQLARAEDYYRKALEIMEGVAPESLRHGETLAALAEAVRYQGRLREATQLYRRALSDLESKSVQLAPIEGSQSRYRAKHIRYYREYIDLLVDQGEHSLAFEVLEGSHARTLFEMLSRSQIDIRQGVDSVVLARERELQQSLNAKSQYRLRLLGNNHTDSQLSTLDKEIANLRDRYQQVEAEIRANSPTYAALSQPQPLSTKEIQQLLDPDTVLLEYSLGEERSFVWLVTDKSLKVYDLPKRSEIESIARRVYALLARHQSHSMKSEQAASVGLVKDDAEYQKLMEELSRMILGPVGPFLGQRRLLVVSDGALQYIPFSVLSLPDSGAVPLIVEHEIVNLPSASVLAELRRVRQGRPRPSREVAVLADPVFESTDERVEENIDQNHIAVRSRHRSQSAASESTDRLSRSAADIGLGGNGGFYLRRLLYTRREAQAIMAVSPPRESIRAIDFQATRAMAVNPALGQYKTVHFATHGLLDSKHPEFSGLVLSLVDKRGKQLDGFLDLQDIYNLNLPVDLIVLSACETALGEEISGEGLIGLTRGFMYAGASRVVASLWAVNDEATSELMARFYRAMEIDHMAPAAALRKAQIQMWKQTQWRSPYYWAAFQLQGEWN